MTTTQTQTVKFDPGYAQHTTILSISLEYIYSSLNSFKKLLVIGLISSQVEVFKVSL